MANCYEITRKWVIVADSQQQALELAKLGQHEEVIVKRVRIDKPNCGKQKKKKTGAW